MPWYWWVFVSVMTPLCAQWMFFIARDWWASMGDHRSRAVVNLHDLLRGERVLVVFGREVFRDKTIEPRFMKLLLRAGDLFLNGKCDRIALLGGDHHGLGWTYAEVAGEWLCKQSGIAPQFVFTPADPALNGRWAFSCSQEARTGAYLQKCGVRVMFLGESQRALRYWHLFISHGIQDPRLFLKRSSEPLVSWLVGLAVTLVDPNEAHILKFIMHRAKRAIVTARDA